MNADLSSFDGCLSNLHWLGIDGNKAEHAMPIHPISVAEQC